MSENKSKYTTAINLIAERLKQAGVTKNEIEDISTRYEMLVNKWAVPPQEATMTVFIAMLKKHGIETKVWLSGGTSAPVKVDQISADNEWISLKGKIIQIWDNRSDKIARTGLIGDETGVIKFTIFAKNEDIIPEEFQEGGSFNFQNFVTSVWNGQFSIKGNKNSKIEVCEPIEANRKTETITGLITTVLQGSGLIKRCPECNRTTLKGACGEHGRVTGVWDIRIKAVFSMFGSNKNYDLIIGTEPTVSLIGMSIEEAKQKAMDELDTEFVSSMVEETIAGKYYTVEGSIMQETSILVNNITETQVCSDEIIKESISKIKGGN